MLSPAARHDLLAIARTAIQERVLGHLPPLPRPAQDSPVAHTATHSETAPPAGAFVTVRLRGELKGCIGYTEADEPLRRVVARCAASAATEDPRFPPVSLAEVDAIRLEISVLTSPEPVEHPDQIEIGRHGLIVELDRRRGLLLPQVATEWGWDRETFLAQTCVKAGLRPDAWKTGAQVYRFEAEVFGEEDGRTSPFF